MVTKCRLSQRRQKLNTRKSRKGGKVIGVGTYGCVFSPPLPCYQESRPPSNYVSKLMAEDDAVSEFAETQKINAALSKIPNHSYYFAGEGIKMCELGDITEQDIQGKECFLSEFSANQVLKTVKRGNVPPNNVRLIQQPNLGVEFFPYLLSDTKDSKKLSNLIRAMNNLLEKGIVVMNSKGIYHQDLKSNNLLVSEQVPRLIDWGYALVTSNGLPVIDAATRNEEMTQESTVPMRAVMMFNAPISAPFFYKTAYDGDLTGVYTDELEEFLANKISKQVYVKRFVEMNVDVGHFEFLSFKMVKASLDVLQANNVLGYENLPSHTFKVIEGYFFKLIDTYVLKNKFDNDAFYRDFYNNIDLWGWATCYLNGIVNAPTYLTAEEKKILNIGCAKLIMYLFTDGAVRLNPKEMMKIMRETADALGTEEIQESPSRQVKTMAPLGSSQRPWPVSAKMQKEPPTPSQSLPKALRSSAFTKKGKMTKSYKDYLQTLGKSNKSLTSIKTWSSKKTTTSVKPTSVKRLSPIKEESPNSKTMKRTKGKSTLNNSYNMRSKRRGSRR